MFLAILFIFVARICKTIMLLSGVNHSEGCMLQYVSSESRVYVQRVYFEGINGRGFCGLSVYREHL